MAPLAKYFGIPGFLIIAVIPFVKSRSCGLIFDRSTVQELHSCMEMFFAPSKTIPQSIWEQSLPSQRQRQQINELIRRLYMSSNYNYDCRDIVVFEYDSLIEHIDLTHFQDIYCIIHERIPNGQKYFKHFWGYVILTNPNNATKLLHHSAAHYLTDGEVCKQAAYIFEKTKSRSLVIAGAARDAVIGNATNLCQPTSRSADVAHNNLTMFHAFNVAIRNISKDFNPHNYVQNYIQWHGMAETSCGHTQAFLSAGAPSSAAVYDDSDALIHRLYQTFNELGSVAETPRTQHDCRLKATTNIFGRYINGVNSTAVCSTNSNYADVKGTFIHIEQKRETRDNLDLWVSVFEKVFSESSRTSLHNYLLVFFFSWYISIFACELKTVNTVL